MTTILKMGAIGLVLAGSTMLSTLAASAAQPISWIYCGDKLDKTHEKYLKAWDEKNPESKIAVEVVGWAQCQDKATTLAAAGTPPAIAYLGSRTLKEFADNDMIVPVPMTDAEKAAYFPHVTDTVTYDGTQWGVPIAFSTKVFYWNKDLFKQAGLDPEKPPRTWAEEIEFAKIIKEKTGIPGYGLSAKSFDNTVHQFLHWVYTNDGKIVNDKGEVVMDNPQVLAALNAYKDIVPFAEEGPTAYEQNEVRAIFLDGKVAMIQGGSGAAVRLQDVKFNWGISTLPLGPDAKGPGTLLVTDSLAIFKGSGVEDKAIEFAKYITSPAIQEEYELATDDGLTPMRPSPAVEKVMVDIPYWRPLVEGIQYGGAEPLFTDWRGFQTVMIAMIQSVVTNEVQPEAALKKATQDLKNLQ